MQPSVCDGAVDAFGAWPGAYRRHAGATPRRRRSRPGDFFGESLARSLAQHHKFLENCKRIAHNGISRIHAPDIDRPWFW